MVNCPVWSNFTKHPTKRLKTFTNNPQNAPKHKQKSTLNIAQRLCNGFQHWCYMLVHACDFTTILQLLHDREAKETMDLQLFIVLIQWSQLFIVSILGPLLCSPFSEALFAFWSTQITDNNGKEVQNSWMRKGYLKKYSNTRVGVRLRTYAAYFTVCPQNRFVSGPDCSSILYVMLYNKPELCKLALEYQKSLGWKLSKIFISDEPIVRTNKVSLQISFCFFYLNSHAWTMYLFTSNLWWIITKYNQNHHAIMRNKKLSCKIYFSLSIINQSWGTRKCHVKVVKLL